jgi:hypothetical protein
MPFSLSLTHHSLHIQACLVIRNEDARSIFLQVFRAAKVPFDSNDLGNVTTSSGAYPANFSKLKYVIIDTFF